MLVAMRRIDVIAPRRQLEPVLRTLQRVGVVHLVPFEPPSGATLFVARASPPGSGVEQNALDWLGELQATLGPGDVRLPMAVELWALDDRGLEERVASMIPVRDLAQQLARERALASAEAQDLEEFGELVAGLRRTMDRLPVPPEYEGGAVVVPSRARGSVEALYQDVADLTRGRCGIAECQLDGDRMGAAIVIPARAVGELPRLAGSRHLDWVPLPKALARLPFDELVPSLSVASAIARTRVERAEAELAALATEHASTVAALRLVLGDRVREEQAAGQAGASDHLFVLSGWVPAGRLSELRSAVGPNVAVAERDPTGAELEGAPVALDNGRAVRAFEPLATFVFLPRYGSLDPTASLAVTFPLFFGFMVGDAGYGLILLALLLVARLRWRGRRFMSALWPVALAATIATIGFGILYGELLGSLGRTALGLRPLWLDRMEAVQSLLLVAIGIGIAQIALGLVLGAVNARRLHARRMIVARLAQLASLMALLVVLGWIAGFLPPAVGWAALVVVGAGLVILALALGLAGPAEMITIAGNVLSYARLMAIALASVMLAVVADRLGALPANLLLGLLIAGGLHVLNIVLGTFDATVQGLRLHYVEFFTKFVEPGTVRYAPFATALRLADPTAGSPG